MKRTFLVLAALAGLTLRPDAAAAQSDILLQLRSGSPAGDRFRVDSASGFVAKGVLGIGIIPFSGAGERLMWHPYKAAFRAGSIGSAGTQWDDANVGFYSWAGGYNTTAAGLSSFAVGYQSSAVGSYSNALGYTANADGTGAVSIGYRTTADADYSVAIGQRASTNGHAGAIVFADGSTTDSLQASANNQFNVRAAGGYRLFSNATMTTGVGINAGGSSWNVLSDRTRKENFSAVSGEDVLARIRSLPVTTWQYTGEEDRTVRHIGPMAQDWHAAFGFSRDDRTINMSDFDGVNLAAIQALEARTTEQAERIRALEAENARLREENARTDERLRRLEALLPQAQTP
ncbi:tail fiber domain-containing protein [Longimicrobium sp.]|uniref:tail fiber domain-containing protein n=1 Tax=Longimicrobium sp. TaxID=2029185 RepID=UPI002E344821|nr:tail fiber domain-containing protein [Longimicrobium sp.]HEX6039948.1 tail fiber domain-containing protein [Longimicrobium sp.]